MRIQAAALEFDAGVMLDRIGVAPGWHCLDLGCGPGGIVEALSSRVGASGRVTGLDSDAVFLESARTLARGRGLNNVDFVLADAYRTRLPRGSFDLVHTRFVASTAGKPQELIAEALALARPGGFVALQEPDVATLKCYPPHPAWERLARLCEQVFERAGSDVRLAQRLYSLARQAGLEDVQYRPFVVGFRSSDPMVDFLPATIESLRGVLVRDRLVEEADLNALLAACRRHLTQPDTVFTYPTVAQVWGRKRK